MGPTVLALIENSIGVQLTLATRLTDLGCQVTIVTSLEAFAEQIHAEVFDWIFLDDAAVPRHRRRFFLDLAKNRRSARVVWCGERPREAAVPMEAVFAKPLRYDEIERFFSHRIFDGVRGKRKSPVESVGPDDATDAEGDKPQ